MINPSRLSPQSNTLNSRLAQDEFKGLDKGFSELTKGDLPSDGLLTGGMLGLNGGTSSFNELLQMSKIDPKKEVTAAKVESKGNGEAKNEKKAETSEKKGKSESNGTKKTAGKETKAKDAKVAQNNPEEQQALAALLMPQQTQQKTVETAQVQTVVNQGPKHTDALKNIPAHQQVQKLEQPQNLNDVLKNLNQKMEMLTNAGVNTEKTPIVGKKDELMDMASKFDEVTFDFNLSPDQSAQMEKLANAQLAKEMQAKDMLQRMTEQEWAQNDLTLRDILSQNAQQDIMMEQMALDRLDAMGRLKDAQFDKMQMQNLQNAALEQRLQLQEVQAAKQPQWQSLKDLSPDQLAMMEALSGNKPEGMTQMNQAGNAIGGNSAVSARLLGNENNNSVGKVFTQEGIGSIQALAGMNSEGKVGQQSTGNNSFSGQNSSGSEATTVGGVAASRNDKNTQPTDAEALADKNAARTREQDRSREMARSAALRAQSLASELAAKGGGTARVQIKDSQLGVVELRINMSDNNRMNVELVANSERIKQELEKQSEDLKNGLEKHKVVLEGVRFATDTKLGDTGFQNSSQNDNRPQQQQQQQSQQGFNSFSQNNSSAGQQGFGQERFFEAPKLNLNNATTPTANAQRQYGGKNEAQTNVQRTANGSLKVIA